MERLIHRIAGMISLGVSLEEIHDRVLFSLEYSEEEFYLAFQAARLICPFPSEGPEVS